MSAVLNLSFKNLTEELPASARAQRQQLDAWVEQCVASQQHEPYSMWLDSAALEHNDSRYHILLRSPEFVLTASERGCQLQSLGSSLRLTEPEENVGMLAFAGQMMTQLNDQIALVGNSHNLPFAGGFAGILGYDLGRQLERLPELNAKDYLTADGCMCFYTEAVIVDLEEQQLWVLADAKQHLTVLNQWRSASSQPSTPFNLRSAWQSNMSREQYGQNFQRVMEYLQAGDSYQINLAQRFAAKYQGDEFAAYQALRQVNGAPFSGFIRLPESCVLSVSPERFLSVSEQAAVETKPIKGTRPRQADAVADERQKDALLHSEKDRAENLMIVDLLRNDLSRSCIAGTVDVPKLFAVESFPAVHHLVSTVVGKLSPDKSAVDLFAAAFPGGSITGAPKIRAMEIIEELEPHRRSVYCGSIAYFSLTGRADSSITIRTLLAEQNTLYCWAGGGLVADSVEAEEYQETLDKVARILPVLENV